MRFSLKLLLSLASLVHLAVAQTRPPNTNPACIPFAEDVGTVYYNPSSTDNIGIYLRGVNCDSGSFVHALLVGPQGIVVDCDFVSLTGAVELVNCPDFPSGAAPEGEYKINFYTGGNPGYFRLFRITHTQTTIEAPTPTIVATESPSKQCPRGYLSKIHLLPSIYEVTTKKSSSKYQHRNFDNNSYRNCKFTAQISIVSPMSASNNNIPKSFAFLLS